MFEDYTALFKEIAEKLDVEPVKVEYCHVKAGGRARGNRIWASCEAVAVHEYVHVLQFSKYTPTIFSLTKSLIKSFFKTIFSRKSVNLVKAFQEGFAEYVTTDVLGYSENPLLSKAREKASKAGRIGFATASYNSYVYGLEYYRVIEKAFGRRKAVETGFTSPEKFREVAEQAAKIVGAKLPDLV
ncbi:MAG: hypothetical protein ACPLZF_04035 [Nitrososphaeria archaeon]